MRKIRLKRVCGHCTNCIKKKGDLGFICKIYGYKISERFNAMKCNYFHRFHKNKDYLEDFDDE